MPKSVTLIKKNTKTSEITQKSVGGGSLTFCNFTTDTETNLINDRGDNLSTSALATITF